MQVEDWREEEKEGERVWAVLGEGGVKEDTLDLPIQEDHPHKDPTNDDNCDTRVVEQRWFFRLFEGRRARQLR